MLTHRELEKRALERADVKGEYERLAEAFALLDESLKTRGDSPQTTYDQIHAATDGEGPPTPVASQR